MGALDAGTGARHSPRAAKLTGPRLVACCQQLVAAYPDAQRLWLVVATWPVHAHPDLLVAFEPHVSPCPRPTPPTWPATASAPARRRWGHLQLPIQLLPLPTYASWGTPIEQVWRKLRQELGHLHPWADDLDQLRAALDHWLLTHHPPSSDLLRSVDSKWPNKSFLSISPELR